MTERQKMTELERQIYIGTAWGAPKENINTLIREYNELAREVNETCDIEWARYEYKEQLV